MEGARPFTIRDFDSFIDDKAINNLHRFAKTVESIFKNELEESANQRPSVDRREPQNVASKDIACDVVDEDGNYVIYIDIPGVEKKDISVNVNCSSHQLQVKLDRKTDDALTYLRRERKSGCFTKTLTLPKEADLNRVEAKYDNGVLKVYVEKHMNNISDVRNVTVL